MHAGTYRYFSLYSFTCLLLQRMLQVQCQSCMLQFKQVLRCTFEENLLESFLLCFINLTKSRIYILESVIECCLFYSILKYHRSQASSNGD